MNRTSETLRHIMMMTMTAVNLTLVLLDPSDKRDAEWTEIGSKMRQEEREIDSKNREEVRGR